MAADDTQRRRQAEDRVKRLFEQTDHEVEEVVEAPGRVARLARPRSGFVRPRTYWRVWLECPAEPGAALAEIEAARKALRAERGLAILVQGDLPQGYRANLEKHTTGAITLWLLSLELSGIARFMRECADADSDRPLHPELFLPRKLECEDGQVVNAVEYIEAWARNPDARTLVLQGEAMSGRQTLLDHIVYRSARAFVNDSERAILVIRGVSRSASVRGDQDTPTIDGLHTYLDLSLDDVDEERFDRFWLVWRKEIADLLSEAAHSDFPQLLIMTPRESAPDDSRVLKLLPPDLPDTRKWYRDRFTDDVYECVVSAFASDREFADFASTPPHLPVLLRAIKSTTENPTTTHIWIVNVVASFMRLWFQEEDIKYDDGIDELLEAMASGALEEFALGGSWQLGALERIVEWPDHWLRSLELSTGAEGDDEHPTRAVFANRLVRDYFLACKIISEVRAGQLDILTRYQFPENYVLLFLAVMAPDVMARVTADRSEEIRAQIQADVEYQVQLTLAHQLRRSAGALRQHMKQIRKSIPEADLQAVAYEMERIEQEIGFLKALAEGTRKWHEVPEDRRESLDVAEIAGGALAPLRAEYGQVEVIRDIPEGLAVLASREGLREIMHNLLENAFQAVALSTSIAHARVTIRAQYEGQGDTVRIRVLDNGPGVPEGDHERIFEPRVTTKKGGQGQPRGTGLGLPIARRYAQHLGGRVDIEPGATETCFYVELVSARKEI